MFYGLIFGLLTFQGNCIPDLISDTCSSCTGSKHDDSQIMHCEFRHMECGHDRGKSYTTGSLDIIIETGNMRPILLQNPPSVGKTEVLKVYVGHWISLFGGFDETLHEVIVFFPTDPRNLEPQIQLIVYEPFVLLPINDKSWDCEEALIPTYIGPTIQHNRQGPRGVDTRAQRV